MSAGSTSTRRAKPTSCLRSVELKKRNPNADFDHLTLVGHSNGGDTAMYFAKQHLDLVAKVVTLDNLRVPFVTSDKMKILSFRSDDPHFQTDPGVLPTPGQAKADGIDIVHTKYQHNWMSDRGPEKAKEAIQEALDAFLGDSSGQRSAAGGYQQPRWVQQGNAAAVDAATTLVRRVIAEA